MRILIILLFVSFNSFGQNRLSKFYLGIGAGYSHTLNVNEYYDTFIIIYGLGYDEFEFPGGPYVNSLNLRFLLLI